MNIFDRVQAAISAHHLIRKGDRIAAGFSGGADSTFLLVALKSLGYNPTAVYINHQLRGEESLREEDHVRAFCETRQIPLLVERIHWKKIPSSLEDAARRRRYRHFEKVCRENQFDRIALAHHAEDVAETFLMRLLRGSGPRGLSGIQFKRGIFIRPMLELVKEEILQTLQKEAIPYFTDSSNLSSDFTRNVIRQNLLPEMQKIQPGVFKSISRAAGLIAEQNRLAEAFIDQAIETLQKANSSRETFLGMPRPVQKMVFRKLAHQEDPSLHLSTGQVAEALKAIEQKRNLELPGFLMLKLDANTICFHRKDFRIGYSEIDVPGPGTYFYPAANANLEFRILQNAGFDRSNQIASLDGDRVQFPLYIRNFRKGDSFKPLGMDGRKKLSDFFIEQKVPRENRKRIPLVCKDDEILWIAGFQINNDYRITSETKRTMRIELRK